MKETTIETDTRLYRVTARWPNDDTDDEVLVKQYHKKNREKFENGGRPMGSMVLPVGDVEELVEPANGVEHPKCDCGRPADLSGEECIYCKHGMQA